MPARDDQCALSVLRGASGAGKTGKNAISITWNTKSATKPASWDDLVRCFVQVDHRGTHTIDAGMGHEIEGYTSMTGNMLHHQCQPDSLMVVASAAWVVTGGMDRLSRKRTGRGILSRPALGPQNPT